MPPTDAGEGVDIDAIEAWDGILRIKREMTLREMGVVVTHRITATGAKPVKFQLVDRFPSTLSVDDVGFHPEYEPAHGRIDAEQALISGVVNPEEELVVTYGVCPSEAHTPEEIKDRQFSTPPSIELAEVVDTDEVDPAELEAAAMPRSSTGAGDEEGSSALFSKILGPLWGPSRDEPAEAETPAEADEGAVPDTMVGRAEAGVGVDEIPGPDDADEREEDQAEEDAPDEAEEPAPPGEPEDDEGEPAAAGAGGIGAGGDPFGPSEDNSALAAAISRAHAEGGGGDDEGEEDTTPWLAGDEDEEAGRDVRVRAGADEPPAADPVEALIDRLEAGELTDDERERLGRGLAELIDEVESPSKLTSLRLRNLEAEVSAMSSYRVALEEIIDEHGPAEEFLSAVRDDIEALGDRVDDLDRALEGAEADREGFEDRLDSLLDEAAVLSSRLERLDERVDALRANHRSKLTALEERLETLTPAVERVEELEEELEAVKASAERAEATRRALAEALVWDEVDEE